jgi:hypothetical protein
MAFTFANINTVYTTDVSFIKEIMHSAVNKRPYEYAALFKVCQYSQTNNTYICTFSAETCLSNILREKKV